MFHRFHSLACFYCVFLCCFCVLLNFSGGYQCCRPVLSLSLFFIDEQINDDYDDEDDDDDLSAKSMGETRLTLISAITQSKVWSHQPIAERSPSPTFRLAIAESKRKK